MKDASLLSRTQLAHTTTATTRRLEAILDRPAKKRKKQHVARKAAAPKRRPPAVSQEPQNPWQRHASLEGATSSNGLSMRGLKHTATYKKAAPVIKRQSVNERKGLSRPLTAAQKAPEPPNNTQDNVSVAPSMKPLPPLSNSLTLASKRGLASSKRPRDWGRWNSTMDTSAALPSEPGPCRDVVMTTSPREPLSGTKTTQSPVESDQCSKPTVGSTKQPAAETAPSAKENDQPRRPAALEPIPPVAKSKENHKPAKQKEHFVRLNLRNANGACRGVRKPPQKPKTAPVRKSDAKADTGSVQVFSRQGTDVIDDYLDGVYTTTKKSRSTIPFCDGHQQPAKKLTVKKSGPNQGRPFYCCAEPRGEQCDFFQWADDTPEATRQALDKNATFSGFVARQVASYMDRIGTLTVPELKDLAKRHGLSTKGKKKELLTRIAIWVRDELARTSPDDEASGDRSQTKSCSSGIDTDTAVRLQKTTDTIDLDDSEDDSDVDDEEDEETVESCAADTRRKDCPLHEALESLFGYTEFRGRQQWAIERCLQKKRTLLVAPTGFGKSLCYALPAHLMDGVCIVVSPLLSLISDQLRVLPPCLPAATLSGSMTTSKMAATIDDILKKRIKILFVSPERLSTAAFRRLFRPKWNSATGTRERDFPIVSLLCVDEAHCLSQWAHNFRPAYLRLKSMIEMINPEATLAITATAGPRVIDDICKTLSIPKEGDGLHVMNSDRDNIEVRSLMLGNQGERLSKLIAILSSGDSEEDDLPGCLASGSVIVYVWRQMDTEAVAENIRAAGVQGGVVVYHGGMDAGSRAKAQDKFMRGKARICVATVAFGLGINKSNVRGVVHMYLSASPEHYLQEIGRAGRDGLPSMAIALVLSDEVLVRHSLAHSDMISKSQIHAFLTLFHKKLGECVALRHTSDATGSFLNVAVPLTRATANCDCKAETIETLASLLEDQFPGLRVEGTLYDGASIAPKRRLLEEIAKHEGIARAVLDCGHCTEQPAGAVQCQSSHLDHDAPDYERPEKLVGHSFGCYSFSVAKCANLLGSDAEPRHVYAALRRLEDSGEIQLHLDKKKGMALHVRVAPECSLLDDSRTTIDKQSTDLLHLFLSSIRCSADKVLDLHSILNHMCGPFEQNDERNDDKSSALLCFQRMIRDYFQSTREGPARSGQVIGFAETPSADLLFRESRAALSFLSDVRLAASSADPYLSLDGSTHADYTALIVTKFLHGIAPNFAPLSTLRQNSRFGSMQTTDFATLLDRVGNSFAEKH